MTQYLIFNINNNNNNNKFTINNKATTHRRKHKLDYTAINKTPQNEKGVMYKKKVMYN